MLFSCVESNRIHSTSTFSPTFKSVFILPFNVLFWHSLFGRRKSCYINQPFPNDGPTPTSVFLSHVGFHFKSGVWRVLGRCDVSWMNIEHNEVWMTYSAAIILRLCCEYNFVHSVDVRGVASSRVSVQIVECSNGKIMIYECRFHLQSSSLDPIENYTDRRKRILCVRWRRRRQQRNAFPHRITFEHTVKRHLIIRIQLMSELCSIVRFVRSLVN